VENHFGLEDARDQDARMGETRQVVAVNVDAETYGIDIACIHAVIMPQEVAHVPRTPSYVLGVTNLRGRVVPILDLRRRFGLSADAETERRSRRIVVVEAAGITAGLVVDAVSEVMHLPLDRIEPPSLLMVNAGTECITGIGRALDGRLLILLDVEKTLTVKPAEDKLLRTLQNSPRATKAA
jgi:purine-binding chemotaxis protein CheW